MSYHWQQAKIALPLTSRPQITTLKIVLNLPFVKANNMLLDHLNIDNPLIKSVAEMMYQNRINLFCQGNHPRIRCHENQDRSPHIPLASLWSLSIEVHIDNLLAKSRSQWSLFRDLDKNSSQSLHNSKSYRYVSKHNFVHTVNLPLINLELLHHPCHNFVDLLIGNLTNGCDIGYTWSAMRTDFSIIKYR